MKYLLSVAIVLLSCLSASHAATPSDLAAVKGLLQRITPEHAAEFICESLPGKSDSGDRFEIESRNGKIILRGNNANSLSVGLNHYLRHHCLSNVSWYADNPIKLPKTLPKVDGVIRQETRCQSRFFLNYCTFGYTMPWWQWRDWERLIDWMALNGVTMPLAITGQEAVWYNVWKKFGLSDEQIRSYFTGPAHLPWHRMANIDYWQGGLPQSWLDHQVELQKRIVAREREFNMTPVLPAFAGHVPAAIVSANPTAKINLLGFWGGFDGKYRSHFLDPLDPLFKKIQHEFLTEQTRLFGTDHVYGADPFNEVQPPSWEPDYLAKVGKTIYDSMIEVDPKATWLQMTWVFYFDREHWTNERIKAMVRSVPQDRMLLLDYYVEKQEVWPMTERYFDQPFLWCYLGNFGGNTMLAGNLNTVRERLDNTFVKGGKGMRGIGSTLEALDVNPVMYDFVFDQAWGQEKSAPIDWIRHYAASRCGSNDPSFLKAWEILATRVYTHPAVLGQGALTNARPTLRGYGNWTTNPAIQYDNRELLEAWKMLLQTKDKSADACQYDIVNVGRQVLSNHFSTLRDRFNAAYVAKDAAKAESIGLEMLELLDDLDRLLATRSDFMLGKWLADAKAIGTNDTERRYYERNARTILTTWGERGQSLNEYANRSWAGLISGYYRKRWEMFIYDVTAAIRQKRDFNDKEFIEKATTFEWMWTQQTDSYPSVKQGDSIGIATELLLKYTPLVLVAR
jgi:alpha-N-acetylglucosaminidase